MCQIAVRSHYRLLMETGLRADLTNRLTELQQQGLYKTERIITSPQSAHIELADGRHALNFCANNYLGLAHHPTVETAAARAIDAHGYGMASVRFICGTQQIHTDLEARISRFLGHGRHRALLVLLRRQWGTVRDPAR